MLHSWLLPLLTLVLLSSNPAKAVKKEDFKTCAQSSFCNRLRPLSSRARDTPDWQSPYHINGTGLIRDTDGGAPYTVKFQVLNDLHPEIRYDLSINILGSDGIARIRMDEHHGLRQRYNESEKWTLVPDALKQGSFNLETDSWGSNITYGSDSDKLRLDILHYPLRIELYRSSVPDIPQIVLNGEGLLHMEHFRLKPEELKTSPPDDLEALAQESTEGQTVLDPKPDPTWFEGSRDQYDKGLFEENWKSWKDTKPKGPEALSIDISFPAATHVYGIPEHAAPLSLPTTDGDYFSDPYRLFNVDIFEYEASSPMALYGAIPLMHAHSPSSSVGVFYLSSSETWVDVTRPTAGGIDTHWMSESGILDLFLLPGSTASPDALFKQYASLTGPSALPAHWALGYHQCRWNYLDQQDMLEVDRRFDADGEGFPLDVTWLDIEYADEHRYFDWDAQKFPDVKGMLKQIEDKGRKVVAIVDPHIKRTEEFYVYKEALEADVLIKNADGKTNYEGWCWTGSSAWVDFFNERSWDYWTGMFKFEKWTNSAKNLFIWNDMNEPSVFNGPEITLPKDTLYEDGKWENRDIHNVNGLMFHKQTALALIAREEIPKRPFVLSRSFFAGSQKYGAIWTGDNMGTWTHLAGSFPMLLSNGIAGMIFAGADVGGFFGNPSPDFLVRWYQAGIFMPFFRAHAHIDTKRREPYLLDEPYKSIVRDMIRLRYAMLPIWYTAFREASVDGIPVLRPQYVNFPKDPAGYAMDDQFYIGRTGLLAKPIVEEESDRTDIYLSDNQPYYDYFSHELYPASKVGRNVSYHAPLSAAPLLHQGSNIIPLRTRIRRSSPLMWQDPYTLLVSLGKDSTASGELYSDDGDSYAFEQGEFIWRGFDFQDGVLKSQDLVRARPAETGVDQTTLDRYLSGGPNKWAKKIGHVRVERIVVLGLKSQPKEVRILSGAGSSAMFEWTAGVGADSTKKGRASELVIKNPEVLIAEDWEILIR